MNGISSFNLNGIYSAYAAQKDVSVSKSLKRKLSGSSDKPVSSVKTAKKKAKESLTGELKQLDFVSRQFESLFLHQLIKSMRKTVAKNELFNGGWAEEVYTDMLDMERAGSWANTRSFGLSTVLFEQLSEGVTGKYQQTLSKNDITAIKKSLLTSSTDNSDISLKI